MPRASARLPRKLTVSTVSPQALLLALSASPLLVSPANAVCGNNPPGDYISPVLCTTTGNANANLILPGPSTVTVGAAGSGTTDAIRSEVSGAGSGNATATISDTTVINNDPNYPSIGIYVLISTFTTPTGNGTLNLSGTNSITTANGTSVLVNVRGTGDATANIEGNITVNSLINNTNDNDGIEVTTHTGGDATLNMGNASGTINVSGGNGILIDSLAGGGNITGTVGDGMTINMNNAVAGGLGHQNSGISVFTQALGGIALTTGAEINTQGLVSDGIRGTAVRGPINVTNTGDITTAGDNSRGIALSTTAGPAGREGRFPQSTQAQSILAAPPAPAS